MNSTQNSRAFAADGQKGPRYVRALDSAVFASEAGNFRRWPSRLGCWILVAVCCLLRISEMKLDALPFEAEGSVTFIQFRDGGERSRSQVNFRILVDGCKYSLRMTQQPNKRTYDYQDVVYDGTNLYYLISVASSVPALLKKAPRNVTNLNAAATFIYQEPILHNALAHQAGPLWLALASGWYLASLTNSIVEGVLSWDASGLVAPDTIRMQKAEWRCQRQFPNLPESVVFFDNGGIPHVWTNMPPYNNGFTSAVYTVSRFAEVESVAFPRESTLLVYFPKTGGRRETELTLLSRYEIRVDDIRLVRDVRILPPELPGAATMIDARFYDKAGNVPFRRVTNWPRTESTVSSPEYQNALRARRAEIARRGELLRGSGAGRRARGVVSVLFCVTTLLAILLLRWFWGKSGHLTTN